MTTTISPKDLGLIAHTAYLTADAAFNAAAELDLTDPARHTYALQGAEATNLAHTTAAYISTFLLPSDDSEETSTAACIATLAASNASSAWDAYQTVIREDRIARLNAA